MRVCEHCGMEFEAKRRDSRHCSRICSHRFYYAENASARRAAKAAYYRANVEKCKASIRASVAKKPDHYRAKHREVARNRREADPARERLKATKWRNKNLEHCRFRDAKGALSRRRLALASCGMQEAILSLQDIAKFIGSRGDQGDKSI